MDVAAIIAEQDPLLESLHTQLGLPATALADDHARIEAAVKTAILSIVRSREDEVAEWEAKITEDKRVLAGLARALGDQGRSVLAAGRRESEQGEHERLLGQSEDLEKVYRERLESVQDLIANIERLSVLLGPPFTSPEPLQAIPGAAIVTRPPASQLLAPPVPPAHPAPTTNSSRRPSSRPSSRPSMRIVPAPPTSEPTIEPLMDVGEEVLEALEKQLHDALAERAQRATKLGRYVNDLIWYHAELALPDLLDTFPLYLLPSTQQEETPHAHSNYQRHLSQMIELNPWQAGTEGTNEGVEIRGIENIEPEIGLLDWCEQLLDLWEAEKCERDDQIQGLYEQIEPLWTRLEIPDEEIQVFINNNLGSGEATIQAYHDELQRLTELRKASLSDFVLKTRKEIDTLQNALMLSDAEKAEFGSYIDDNFTEELLEQHEEEANRLRAEVELRGPMLPKVKEWLSIKEDEEELERNAQDPNRFKKRGAAVFREEKMRKRVEKLKPKIESELLQMLPQWEEEHERPFLAYGERIIDTIKNAIAVKEAAKEARKRAKMGLGTTTLQRGGPGAASNVTGSQPGTSRRRIAPTPNASLATGVKRQRVVSTASSASAASVGPPRTRARLISPTAFETPTASISRTRGRMFGQPAVGLAANSGPATRRSPVASSLPRPRRPLTGLAKAEGRRPRKTFRPRPSMAAGLLNGLCADALAEDEEDVF